MSAVPSVARAETSDEAIVEEITKLPHGAAGRSPSGSERACGKRRNAREPDDRDRRRS